MKKRILLGALFLANAMLIAPPAKADPVYYYEDEPVVTHHRVYTERRYVETVPTYRREEVRVYRGAPVEERVYYREDRPHYILPPGPHRIIQHILFGDPIE